MPFSPKPNNSETGLAPTLKITVEAEPAKASPKPKAQTRAKLAAAVTKLHAHAAAQSPSNELGTISQIYGDGYFDVDRSANGATMTRVFCINRDSSGLQIGDTVLVRFYDNDPQKPYIKSQGVGNDGSTAKNAKNDKIHIDLHAGMWLQAGGFWWEPYVAVSPVQPLALNAATSTIVQSYPNDADIQYFGSGVYLPLPLIPLGINPSDVIFVNFALDGGSPNTSLPAFSGYVAPNQDFFGDPLPRYYLEGITAGTFTTLDLSLQIPTRPVKTLLPGVGGMNKAISLRGNVMFPDPRQAGNQIEATLQPLYAPAGGEAVQRHIEENVNAPGGGVVFGVAPTFVPVEGTFDTQASSFAAFDTAGALYAVEFTGAEVVAYVYAGSSGITVDYQYYNGTEYSYTEGFVVTGDQTTFAVSGPISVINQVRVDNNPLDPNLYSFVPEASDFTFTLATPPGDGTFVEIDWTQKDKTAANDFFFQSSTCLIRYTPVPGTIVMRAAGSSGGPVGDPTTLNALQYEYELTGAAYPDIKLRILYQIPPSSVVHMSYDYMSDEGELFYIKGMKITERDLVTGFIRVFLIKVPTFDASPLKAFTRDLTTTGPKRWKMEGDWNGQWWCFFQYDPSSDGYNVISTAGLHWRSRDPGNVEGVNYTTMPWEEYKPSKDKYITGYSWPANNGYPKGTLEALAPGLRQKTAPYMGVGLMLGYAASLSWPPLGPGKTDEHGGFIAAGDVTFPLNFYKRDKNYVWVKTGSITPYALIKGNSGKYPLYIPPCGIIHQEGKDGYASARTWAQPKNTVPTASRDCEAWIVGCSWLESDFGVDHSDLTKIDTYNGKFPLGARRAGYTLNAIDPSDVILDQLTFTNTLGYTENMYSGSDTQALVNLQLAHSRDFIAHKHYGGSETGSAYDRFGWRATDDIGGGDYAFFAYTTTTLDGAPKTPLMLNAGVPTPANTVPRYSDGYSINAEDNASTHEVVGDDSDNFYLCLSHPYWARDQNSQSRILTEEVYGSHVVGDFTIDNFGEYNFVTRGYREGPCLSRVRDGIQYVADKGFFPTANGQYIRCFPQSGYSTPFFRPEEDQVVFVAPIITGYGYPLGHEGDAAYKFPIYQHQVFTNLTVPWAQEIPIRTSTETDNITDFRGWTITIDTGDGRMHGDFPRSITVYDGLGDHRKNFRPSALTFLYKVKLENGKLKEVWRKDISIRPELGPSLYYGVTRVSTSGATQDLKIIPYAQWYKVHVWRPCGRYIFVLRNNIALADAVFGGVTSKIPLEVLTLEVYTNPDTSVGPVIFKTIYLPVVPTPFLYADYPGAPGTSDMVCGLTADDEEWCIVLSSNATFPFLRWKLVFPADDTMEPTITFFNGNDNLAPNNWNAQGIAVAKDLFFWTGNDGALFEAEGG